MHAHELDQAMSILELEERLEMVLAGDTTDPTDPGEDIKCTCTIEW